MDKATCMKCVHLPVCKAWVLLDRSSEEINEMLAEICQYYVPK